ncbi:MAG: class I SAM-dependent methyltransferase [Verrucomicrobiota bacterium]
MLCRAVATGRFWRGAALTGGGKSGLVESLREMSPTRQPVTEYFSELVGVYAQFRPDYPDAAAAYVLGNEEAPVCVADIGCGTGISTRWLARNGGQVTGVEPNDEMRGEATRESHPGTAYHVGSAEDTGLGSSSFDRVICAQSFHWFDFEKAVSEFHRILRPEGRLALIWNVRERTSPFGAAYDGVIKRAHEAALEKGLVVRSRREADLTDTLLFAGIEKKVLPHSMGMKREELIGYASSNSYFPTEGALRRELVQSLSDLFEEHQRGGRIVFKWDTELTLADRVPVGEED